MDRTADMLDVPLTSHQIRAFYAGAAPVYDEQTARHEARPKELALDLAARRPGEDYLEVAVGTGMSIVEQVRRSGPEGIVGIDLTGPMLALTRSRLAEVGGGAVRLLLGDARRLPFADASFDCLFNSYMLDLIPTADISLVLAEYRRVLRPGGRLVMANLTEGEGDDVEFSRTWKERFLQDPARLGGCRPVLAGSFAREAGFVDVTRVYCGQGESWPTEVVTARLP